jgi:hypothetical protein
MMLKPFARTLLCAFVVFLSAAGRAIAADVPKTERLYLSGHGPEDAVPWGFTVTGGRRAGEQTTIPVPSNWEQQGFGTYSYGEQRAPRANEQGLYRLHFTAPAAWNGQRIHLVFEGVMTDATVKLNGQLAGPTHQGAFYRFYYDVTKTLKPGAENVLQVEVAKESANPDTNTSERTADYWVFGGIFRPVWLEVQPLESIEHTAIDAQADGTLIASVELASSRIATRVEGQVMTLDGLAVGAGFSTAVPAGGGSPLRLLTHIDAPKLWTAETPNLYDLKLTLFNGKVALHTTTERFGFRTFEVRPRKGLYLNGQRILLKGVNRHSFRPEKGRSLDREDNYADARLIKSMNMNAVRMSHYPPDPAFLEAADELGIYVLDELSGWHHAHDTDVGRRLVREMVDRDVNHPSILFWDNGNEGGWNRDLDGEFALYDPQQRRVLHPWEVHDDVDTKHYPNYDDLTRRLAGPNVLMPTEFLHAIYDGGGGAGLEDYWKALSASAFGGGGFIWDLADEGIARTDRDGAIDVFSTYAPDGVVGPHAEKEGSYYAIRDLWSPVQIATPDLSPGFDGTLRVSNNYDFNPLSRVRFQWQWVRFPGPIAQGVLPSVQMSGEAAGPAVGPHAVGTLKLELPQHWRDTDALMLTAIGPDKQNVWTWTWPVSGPVLPPVGKGGRPTITTGAEDIRLSVGAVSASFDPVTGLLRQFKRDHAAVMLTKGPRLVFEKARGALPTWLALDPADEMAAMHRLATAQMANLVEVDLAFDQADSYAGFKLDISADRQTWKTIYNSTRRDSDGNRYTFPPQIVSAIRISSPIRDSGLPIFVKAVRVGFEADRFPAVPMQPATVTSGKSHDPKSGQEEAWVEAKDSAGLRDMRWTLRGDGSLKLDYSYDLTGDYIYHGITFDHREDCMTSVRSLGAGPYRVWQNRLRGAELRVREVERHVDGPGSLAYPEFQGYFGDLQWARFNTDVGPWAVFNGSAGVFLRIGTPQLSHINTSPDFPSGDVSFLWAIPAMGSKFVTPERSGPVSQPAKAVGTYTGSLLFTLPAKFAALRTANARSACSHSGPHFP